jgi:hypothetical protein
MVPLARVEFPAFELFASRIRGSSNFRVAWQMFQCDGPCKATPRTARQILETICLVPELHLFLAPEVQDQPPSALHLHEHCFLEPAAGSFENILARAVADRLGAYSHSLAEATRNEMNAVRDLFNGPGSYVSFELLPGEVAECATCQAHNGHLFSDWFYAVAWDWCHCIIWETRKLALLWCMSDTD